PVVLRPSAGAFELIAGLHRLRGAERAGWNHIRAEVREGLDADEAELIELLENLIRADLTPAEEAAHHARRKELYERLHPATKAGVAQGLGMIRRAIKNAGGQVGPQVEETFSKAIAKATGVSQRKIKRDLTRAHRIANISELAGTSLDKGEELDALAKLPE